MGNLELLLQGSQIFGDRYNCRVGTAHPTTLVAIKMPRNLVQNGFYMAVGNAGTTDNDRSQSVRIYFNLSPEGAVAVMGSLTQQLNAIAIPFVFKVLYNPDDYGRYDSGVFYFSKSDYEVLRQVLQRVYLEQRSQVFKKAN